MEWAKENLVHECVVCKIRGKLVVHHKNGNRDDNRPENLEYRCPKHHIFGRGAAHPHTRNRLGIKWTKNMKQKISSGVRKAFENPDIRNRHLEALQQRDKTGRNNPNYKHGRYVQ